MHIKTPEFVTLQFKLAGLGSRAAAIIIDLLIITIVNILLGVIAYFTMNSLEELILTMDVAMPIAIVVVIIFIFYWGYFLIFEYFNGGKTIGKKIVGIRVIQDNGHSITLLSSIIRNLMRIIDMLPIGYFIGIVMIFFHSKHQRFGDIVAGTIVVHEREGRQNSLIKKVEKTLASRSLSKESFHIEPWQLRALGKKEWELVKTYSYRLEQISPDVKNKLTRQVASIIFPKIGLEMEGKHSQTLEDTLLILYIHLHEEWEYEL